MSAANLMTCVVHGPTVLRPSLVINNARGLLSFLTRRAHGHVRVARRAGRTHRRRSAVCTVLQYSPPNEAIVSMASYAKTQAHALTTRTRNWGGGAQQSAEAAPGGGGAGQAGGPGRQRSPAWQPDSVPRYYRMCSMDLWIYGGSTKGATRCRWPAVEREDVVRLVLAIGAPPAVLGTGAWWRTR